MVCHHIAGIVGLMDDALFQAERAIDLGDEKEEDYHPDQEECLREELLQQTIDMLHEHVVKKNKRRGRRTHKLMRRLGLLTKRK